VNTLKKVLYSAIGLAIFIGCAALGDSGINGTPFNPTFGALSSTSVTVTRAASASTFAASKGVTAAQVTTTGRIQSTNAGQQFVAVEPVSGHQFSIQNAGDHTVLSQSSGNVYISTLDSCVRVVTPGVTPGWILPCSGASTAGAGNYIFTANAAQSTVSGQLYSFQVTNSGTTCAAASGGPGFPTGWSVARTSTGICTFTFPAVTAANKMVLQLTPFVAAAARYCIESSDSTTTAVVECYNSGGTATDTSFVASFQDWN
jgi:hypothetical protein